jgi:hypothetical protein
VNSVQDFRKVEVFDLCNKPVEIIFRRIHRPYETSGTYSASRTSSTVATSLV